MKKNIIIGAIILLLAIIVWFVLSFGNYKDQDDCTVSGGAWDKDTKQCGPKPENNGASSVQSATYLINNENITLVNGLATTAITPGAASKTVTRYFGNAATGDLNNDGQNDTAFLLTQESGGSGIFYYVAVALMTGRGYQGLNAIFLGDRIAPQTTAIKDGQVIVNYADRNPGDPLVAPPSVGVAKYFKVVAGKLIAE